MTFVIRLALSGLIATLASAASAVDGVREINQTCAVNTGCFAGDTAGFPVTVDGTAGRSVVLTGDLTVPNANTTAIQITTNDVNVDLNGFAIIGPGGSGSGSGVLQSGGLMGVSVFNGNVRRMGDRGISLGREALVRDINSSGNGGDGIGVSNGSVVSRNTLRGNAGDGISAGGPSVISENAIFQNGGDGIAAFAGSSVIGNAVASSTDFGLRAIGTVGYALNTFTSNNGGNANAQVSGGTEIGENICGLNAVCP